LIILVIDAAPLGLPIDPFHVAASPPPHPLWLNYCREVILLRLLSQSTRLTDSLACRPADRQQVAWLHYASTDPSLNHRKDNIRSQIIHGKKYNSRISRYFFSSLESHKSLTYLLVIINMKR